ncbi:MAG TPA: hypothetical protein QF646_02950 [Candidatus Poseidoniales archaeon]|nr:hypothetical protein [Candidatus Poseidoniales archaeon]
MVRMRVVLIVLVVALFCSVSAGEGTEATGVPVVLEADSQVVSSITHSSNRSYDETPWSVEIVLTPTAASNNTTMMLNPLICDITGFCYPPFESESWVVMSFDSNGSVWTGSVTPPADHDYIDYAITATFQDDDATQRMPSMGYVGKVWAQCHYTSDASDSSFDKDCPLSPPSDAGMPSSSSEESGILHPALPSPAIVLTIISLSLVALLKRNSR